MTTPKDIALAWVEGLARNDPAVWDFAAETLVMEAPYTPPGLFGECAGRDACREMTQTFFAQMQSFGWYDIDIHATDREGVIFGTARSEATTITGASYTNRYTFTVVVTNGRVLHYTEYFNPLPVMTAFGISA